MVSTFAMDGMDGIDAPISYLSNYPFPACIVSAHDAVETSPNATFRSEWVNPSWTGMSHGKALDSCMSSALMGQFIEWITISTVTPFKLTLSHIRTTLTCIKTPITPRQSTSSTIYWVITATGPPSPIPPSHNSPTPSPRSRNRKSQEQLRPIPPLRSLDCKQLLKEIDWSKTSLGPRDKWPAAVETMISVIMASPTQDALWLGPEFLMLYNQNYSHIVHHPMLYGQSAKVKEAWGPVWEGVSDLIDRCLTLGESCHRIDDLLLYRRGPRGYWVEKYHTWSFIPIFDTDGKPLGLYNPTVETTASVLARRRQETTRDMAEHTLLARTQKEYYDGIGETLTHNPKDVPFALCYSVHELPDGKLKLKREMTIGVPDDHPSAKDEIIISYTPPRPLRATPGLSSPTLSAISALSHATSRLKHSDEKTFWPIGQAITERSMVVMNDCTGLIEGYELRQWDQLPDSAIVIPFCSDMSFQTPRAVMVLGLNSQCPLDEPYEEWLHVLRAHLTSSLASVIANEAEQQRIAEKERMARAQTAWFSGAAHDIRSPLTLVAGPLDDVLRSQLKPAQRQALTLAQRNVTRIQRLVGGLLDFSRIEAGKLKGKFMPLDVSTFVLDLANLFRPAAERKRIQFRVDIQRHKGQVAVDPTLLETAVTNLLSNAIKYTQKGSIDVTVRFTSHVEIAVKDTGCGIPAEELGQVTDRYNRATTAIKSGVEGTGIGLALSNEIVKLHQGELLIQSQAIDPTDGSIPHGSTFTIRIPIIARELDEGPMENRSIGIYGKQMVEEAMHFEARSESEVSLGTDGTEETARSDVFLFEPGDILLLVDDSADIRNYVRRIFSPYCTVIEAKDGEEGFRLAKKHRPHLILCDMMMPKMNGHELLDAVRNEPDIKGTPMVMLSAAIDEEVRLSALIEHSAEDFMLKPFKPKELLARVHLHMQLGKRRAFLEAQFAQREREIAVLSDLCPSGIIRADPTGRLIYANKAWRECCGMSDEEDSQNWPLYLDEPNREMLQRVWSEFVESSESRTQITWKWANGKTISGMFVRLENVDQTHGILGCLQDVTYQEEKLMEAERRRFEAEEAKRQQELWIDMTSHEIRTPVSAILQCSSLAKENLMVLAEKLVRAGDRGFVADRPLLDELHQDIEALESIYQCGLVQERIANDVLSLARVQLDMLDLFDTDTSILREGNKIISAFKSEAKTKRIELDLVVGSSISRTGVSIIKTDHVRLGQVVTNLVSNAMRFTANSPRRRITLKYEVSMVPPLDDTCEYPSGVVTPVVVPLPEDTPVWLFVSVQDTGPGLAPAERANLFQRFSQGSNMIHSQYGGSGLGLFICRKITELLGGRIEVQSTLGEGSTFRFFIQTRASSPDSKLDERAGTLPPAVDAPDGVYAHIGAATVPTDDGKSERTFHALVVEDNVINQTVLRRQLLKAGWQCDVANNGQEALHLINEKSQDEIPQYDVVLMDLEMPVMDGITAVKHIRENERQNGPETERQLVIALTGNARQEQIDQACQAGMNDVVIKPYKLPVLISRIEEAIRSRNPAEVKRCE